MHHIFNGFCNWFLDVFASFVHFLGTGLCSFNKIFILLIKKKKKNIFNGFKILISYKIKEILLKFLSKQSKLYTHKKGENKKGNIFIKFTMTNDLKLQIIFKYCFKWLLNNCTSTAPTIKNFY